MKIFTSSYLSCLLLAFLGLLAGHPARVAAQSYQLPATGTASYTTCSGTLYDDGGSTDSYDSNASGSVTLRPGTLGGKIKLEFTLLEVDSVNVACYVYDGPDTSSPLIDRLYNGRPTVYATGSTGALTVVLRSYGLPKRGFAATISCVTGTLPAPDLAVQSVVLKPALAPAGDYFVATARLGNLTGGLAAYRLRFLLSADTKVDAGDLELAHTDFYAVAGTAGSSGQQFKLPSNTAPGTYYVLGAAQLLGATPEANTSNNLAYAQLTVPPATAIPDLTITRLSYDAPPRLGAGSFLYTLTRVQNLGRTLAQSAEVGYYLSADAMLSPDDQLLGKDRTDVPTDGKSSLLFTTIMLPPVIAPGPYYLLCVADHLDLVIEADEQNNVFALPLLVQPPSVDLDFGRHRTLSNTQPGAGSRLKVTCTLQNEGSASLDSAGVGYYLSADRLLSADDVLLGRASAGPLWPGDTYYGSVAHTVTIPAGTPPGKRYLLLAADYQNRVAELDETNNVAPLPLEVVAPDVDLTSTAPRNGSIYNPTVGSLFYTRCTLANRGTTSAYPATVSYLFSTDNQLSADDLLLSQTPAITLVGGGSQVLESSFTLPANVAPGAYYLLFVTDYLTQVAETDETNNLAPLAIQVGRPMVDLELPYNFNVLPTRAAAGTEAKVAYYFANNGSTPTQTPAVGFYLSTDETFSPDDVLVGDNRLTPGNALYPANYLYLTSTISIPRPLAPGRYYLLGVADYLNEFAETDETNNVRAALDVTPTRPDLLVVASPYVSPKRAVAGSQVTTESYVYNIGAGLARPTKVGYYLSADPVLSPNDVLLGSTTTDEVGAGYSTIVADKFTLPVTTASGRYYVLFLADYLNQLDDDNRDNNFSYTTLSVSALPLAAREQTAGYTLSVAPNPVAGPTPLRVQLSGLGTRGEATLTLLNSLGQQVATQALTLLPGRLNQAEIDTRGLAAGMYLLRLTGPELNATRRLVVE